MDREELAQKINFLIGKRNSEGITTTEQVELNKLNRMKNE